MGQYLLFLLSYSFISFKAMQRYDLFFYSPNIHNVFSKKNIIFLT